MLDMEDFAGIESLSFEQKCFLIEYSDHWSVLKAAESSGVSALRHYEWQRKDEEYEKWFDIIERMINDRIREEAVRRGVKGTKKGIYHRGECIATETEYSDTLLKGVLAARCPEYAVSKPGQGSSSSSQNVIENQIVLMLPDNKRGEADVIDASLATTKQVIEHGDTRDGGAE